MMKSYQRLKSERGDTLIEVLVAIAILSMVIVSAQTVMGHGLSIAMRSVERTEAQGDLNSQFSFLRFARNEYISDPASAGGQMWQAIAAKATTGASDARVCDVAQKRPFKETNMFFVDESAVLAATSPAMLAAAVKGYSLSGAGALPVPADGTPEPGKGIWLVARSGSAGSDYIDFYAKSCWTSLVGPSMEQLTSVMRLYVP